MEEGGERTSLLIKVRRIRISFSSLLAAECRAFVSKAGVGSIIFLLWSAERHKVLDWELA